MYTIVLLIFIAAYGIWVEYDAAKYQEKCRLERQKTDNVSNKNMETTDSENIKKIDDSVAVTYIGLFSM